MHTEAVHLIDDMNTGPGWFFIYPLCKADKIVGVGKKDPRFTVDMDKVTCKACRAVLKRDFEK